MPEHRIYILSDIKEQDNYEDQFELLETATRKDTIRFIINSTGGSYFTTIQFVHLIRDTRAKTIADVHVALSGAATIALACDRVKINPWSFIMIHAARWPSDDTLANSRSQLSYIHDNVKDLYGEIFKGFLTNSEFKRMIDGVDIYIDPQTARYRLKSLGKLA